MSKTGNWKVLTINEIKADDDSAIAIGPFGSRMKSEAYVVSGVPVIRGSNISDTRAITGDFVYISDEKADELKSSNIFANDLFFPHRGAIGLVGIVPPDKIGRYILSSSLMKLTCNEKIIDPLFLFYFFRSSAGKYELLKNSSTVGTPGIGTPLASLKSIRVPLPPLPIQRRIAEILGRLDDKIEVNRRINRTLEAMAQALYKHWFVDFGPFQDGEFVESELGLIPRGWRVAKLGDMTNIVSGRSYKSIELQESSTSLVTLKSFNRGGGYKRDGLKPYTGPYKLEQVIKPGEVVIACTDVTQNAEVIGKPALVQPHTGIERLIASLDCLIIRPRITGISSEYLYLLFSMSDFQAYTYAHTNGTTVLHLTKSAVPEYRFVLPPSPVLTEFTKVVAKCFCQIATHQLEIEKLTEIRDYLLPKLLSGEIPVEAAIAEV